MSSYLERVVERGAGVRMVDQRPSGPAQQEIPLDQELEIEDWDTPRAKNGAATENGVTSQNGNEVEAPDRGDAHDEIRNWSAGRETLQPVSRPESEGAVGESRSALGRQHRLEHSAEPRQGESRGPPGRHRLGSPVELPASGDPTPDDLPAPERQRKQDPKHRHDGPLDSRGSDESARNVDLLGTDESARNVDSRGTDESAGNVDSRAARTSVDRLRVPAFEVEIADREQSEEAARIGSAASRELSYARGLLETQENDLRRWALRENAATPQADAVRVEADLRQHTRDIAVLLERLESLLHRFESYAHSLDSPLAPVLQPRSMTRGFAELAAQRSHVDRRWY